MKLEQKPSRIELDILGKLENHIVLLRYLQVCLILGILKVLFFLFFLIRDSINHVLCFWFPCMVWINFDPSFIAILFLKCL